jgi:hypothetical protein
LELVFVPAGELLDFGRARAASYVRGCGPDLRASLGEKDEIASLLETIRLQLEGERAGARYPLVKRIADAFAFPMVLGWELPELASLLGELQAIREGLERLPLEKQATVMFADDGGVAVYAPESPRLGEILRATHGDRAPKNVWEFNREIVERIVAVSRRGIELGNAVMIW